VDQYCFVGWRLSSVTLPAGQYGYVPLGRHLVLDTLTNYVGIRTTCFNCMITIIGIKLTTRHKVLALKHNCRKIFILFCSLAVLDPRVGHAMDVLCLSLSSVILTDSSSVAKVRESRLFALQFVVHIESPNVHHRQAKFRGDRSNRCWHYNSWLIFRDGDCPPSWICYTRVWITHEY